MATTLAQIRGRAQRLADMENSDYVDDAEWLDYINEGLGNLHDKLIAKSEDYALSSSSITIVNGTDTYNLPSDFYKLRGVDMVRGGNNPNITLHPFMFAERNRRQYATGHLDPGYVYQYHIQGTQIRFIPTPSASDSVTVWYAPTVTQLASDGDTVDSFILDTWCQWVVLHAAIRAGIKEESDTSQLERQLAEFERRVEFTAANRDAGAPKKMVDVRHAGDWLPFGSW